MEQLFTADEVAAYLRVDRNTVYIWCRRGDLPAIKVGKEWRITESDLEAFLARGRTATGPLVSWREMLKTRVGAHEHLLVLVSQPEDVWSLEAEFFALALEQGHRLFKGCWWQQPDDVRHHYHEAGLPVAALEARGDLVIHDFNAAYRRGGGAAVVELWRARGREGYFWGAGSYRTGDWDEQLPALVAFEAGLHAALSQSQSVAICPVVPTLETAAGRAALFELTLHHSATLLQLPGGELTMLRPDLGA